MGGDISYVSLLKARSNLTLNTFSDEASTTSLVNLLHMVKVGLVSASFISLKTFYWIPWTSVCSGSLGDLKTDLLQWWRLNTPSLCLKIWGVDRCRKRDYQWKLINKKNVLVPQTSPLHFSIVLLPYLLWEVHFPFLSRISVKAFLASLHYSLPSSSCALTFLIPSLHIWTASLSSSKDICPWFHFPKVWLQTRN